MSIKIYCENCGAEIKDGEKFYEACLGEFYCKDCVKEQTLTYFTVDSEPIGTNEDTGIYFNFFKERKRLLEEKLQEFE